MHRSRVTIGSLALVAAASILAPVAEGSTGTTAQPGFPPGFVASSTSWPTAADGWLMGFRACSATKAPTCPVLRKTTDAGATWLRAAAPGVRVSPRFRQVKIVFAGPTTGLASDGRRLFMTDDGAKSWQRAALPTGASLGDVGFTGSAAYAVIGTGTTDDGSTALYSTAIGENDWAPVPNVHTAGNGVNVDGGYDLATRGDIGVVALGRIFVDTGYWTTANGTTWKKRPAPCTVDQLPSFNWVSKHQVVATCSYDPGMSKQFKDVRVSVDGGAFSTTTSAPIDLFTNAASAATSTSPFIGASAAGVGWLYGTFDDGATWKTVLMVDDELPFYDLQFPDAKHGFVVSGGSAYGRGAVYTTTDGGRTWQTLHLR